MVKWVKDVAKRNGRSVDEIMEMIGNLPDDLL